MADISIDQLAAEVTRTIQEYTNDVSAGIEQTVDDVAEQVLIETVNNAPKKHGGYAKAFVKTRKALASHGDRRYVIWNKKYYRRVHLLEFGHAKVGGGRVKAYPHMIPAFDKYVPQLETRIKRVIRNGGDS